MTIPPPSQLLDFSGQNVLVTGAGRGIGAGIAHRFAAAGAAVAVNYHSSGAAAQEVVEQIQQGGGTAVAIQADVTRSDEVARLIEATTQGIGGLDVLINNAGNYPLASLADMSEGEWQSMIDSNLKSVFLCTQAASRVMADSDRGGAIVNIASISGEDTAFMHSHYNAAKAGVLMHTRAAALELSPSRIRVNSVSPGLIWRQGIKADWPDGVKRWQDAAPMTRLGRAEDVADACLFLASPAARWITGVNLRVDGGVGVRPAF